MSAKPPTHVHVNGYEWWELYVSEWMFATMEAACTWLHVHVDFNCAVSKCWMKSVCFRLKHFKITHVHVHVHTKGCLHSPWPY